MSDIDSKRQDSHEPFEDRREGVEAADATGLVAGEELISQAETRVTPDSGASPARRSLPSLPHRELHAKLPQGHDAHAKIDALRAETESATPSKSAIGGLVAELRSLPELRAEIELWFENPNTQRIIAGLDHMGL